ncbi:MAG: archaeosine biosynthesis radical SAM protein RaSEA [Thermoplasmatota archaeon]
MSLHQEIRNCHQRTDRSTKRDLVTSWKEKELYKSEIKDAFSVIFRTKGCFWAYESGCSMCGYYTATNPDITKEDLEEQLNEALDRYDGEDMVKIYISGSFLDEDELPKDIGLDILKSFDAEKILIESRPQFVKRDELKDYDDAVDQLEIALGLESANDFVLKNSINKGFTFSDYKKAVETAHDNGCSIRTYLLLKPPFLTEKEAILDTVNSIEQIRPILEDDDIISINPVNVQNGSLAERMWYRDEYRPPWLWSIVDVLKKIDNDIGQTIVVSNAGLGSRRGAHNSDLDNEQCDCDQQIIDKINEFNLQQDTEVLDELPYDCPCYPLWRKEKELAPYLHYRGDVDILSNRHAGYI